jgi:hypothetical protein
MFGNPDWFKPKTIGWGLTPVRWQGWAYTLAWVGIIGLPFALLLLRGQPTESLTWLAVTCGALIYDVRDILHKMQRVNFNDTITSERVAPQSDVFYIGDSQAGNTSVATRNYSFKVK